MEGLRCQGIMSADNSPEPFVLVSSFIKAELEPEGMITIEDGKLYPVGYHEHGQRMVDQIVKERILYEGKIIEPDENPLEWLQLAERLSGYYRVISPVISGDGI